MIEHLWGIALDEIVAIIICLIGTIGIISATIRSGKDIVVSDIILWIAWVIVTFTPILQIFGAIIVIWSMLVSISEVYGNKVVFKRTDK